MSTIDFRPLKHRRLSGMIEDSIKDMILTGQISVGSKLPTEKSLAEQFGVSVVTVREALRGLEAIGIVAKKRGKGGGVFITRAESHVVKDAVQVFLSSGKFSAKHLNDVRRIIEPAMVRMATTEITAEELAEIETNIKYCVERLEKRKFVFSSRDFWAIEESNVEFHRLIAKATHNPILTLTVDYVEDFLLSFKKSTLVPDIRFSQRVVKEHQAIYNALKAGDAEIAEKEMLGHIESVGEALSIKESKA
jgi:GntR family transcriptional repressor for pyruvate dehydrogenase complex